MGGSHTCHFATDAFIPARNAAFKMPPQNATGQFTVSFLAKDQDKVDDLCTELFFNYTRADEQ